MSNLKISYMGVRKVLNFYDLTEDQQIEVKKDYDDAAEEYMYYYGDDDEKEVCLFEFMRIEHNEHLKSFDGFMSDSYFSGRLIKLLGGNENFKLFNYWSIER